MKPAPRKPKATACNCGHEDCWHEEWRGICRYPGGCRRHCIKYVRRARVVKR
jgi:hypothetical protein